MAEELLVRAYNVGVGDCIYVQIPDRAGKFHILIDCGTLGAQDLLAAAFADLESMLPDADDGSGKKRLDLLVITHRHKDHIRGIGLDLFDNIEVNNIWLSAAMNKNHPQAQLFQAFKNNVQLMLESMDTRGFSLAAADALAELTYPYERETEKLENGFGVKPDFVTAGSTWDAAFKLKDTRIHVLGPENDIDRFYLGEDIQNGGSNFNGFSPGALANMSALNSQLSEKGSQFEGNHPVNISTEDFERLRSRMKFNALAFAYKDNSFRNNTSVVLLIEWRGRRLLFTGDAEWSGAFAEGKENGSWNVMWHQRCEQLNKPLDFLKVGHHGSENATPWHSGNKDHEVNEILEAILPTLPEELRSAKAIISTQRKNYASIPGVNLVQELGKRVTNAYVYAERLTDEHKTWIREQNIERFTIEELTLSQPQPARTDFESLVSGKNFTNIPICQSPDWQPQ